MSGSLINTRSSIQPPGMLSVLYRRSVLLLLPSGIMYICVHHPQRRNSGAAECGMPCEC